MARMPSRLKVGARSYELHANQAMYDRVTLESGKMLEGHTSHPNEQIIFRIGRSANWTADTGLHELLHCCFNVHGVDIDNIRRTDIDLEEYIVSVLSPILLLALRENPDFVAFLLDPEVPWETEALSEEAPGPLSPPLASEAE